MAEIPSDIMDSLNRLESRLAAGDLPAEDWKACNELFHDYMPFLQHLRVTPAVPEELVAKGRKIFEKSDNDLFQMIVIEYLDDMVKQRPDLIPTTIPWAQSIVGHKNTHMACAKAGYFLANCFYTQIESGATSGNESIIDSVEQIFLREDMEPELKRSLGHWFSDVADKGMHTDKIVTILLNALNSQPEKGDTALALSIIGERHDEYAEPVLKALKASYGAAASPVDRKLIVMAIGNIGELQLAHVSDVIKTMGRILREETDKDVKLEAVEKLGAIGGYYRSKEFRDAVEAARSILYGTELWDQLWKIYDSRPTAEATAVLEFALHDREPEVRDRAIGYLGAIGSHHEAFAGRVIGDMAEILNRETEDRPRLSAVFNLISVAETQERQIPSILAILKDYKPEEKIGRALAQMIEKLAPLHERYAADIREVAALYAGTPPSPAP